MQTGHGDSLELMKKLINFKKAFLTLFSSTNRALMQEYFWDNEAFCPTDLQTLSLSSKTLEMYFNEKDETLTIHFKKPDNSRELDYIQIRSIKYKNNKIE